MRNVRLLALQVGLSLVAACSDSTDPPAAPVDAGGTQQNGAETGAPDAATGAEAGVDAGPAYVEPTNCALRDDSGGPGQYSDGCVKRAWIAEYAGAYASPKCELTIRIDGSVAATFAMKILAGSLAGEYATDWDGAPSPGNDSYYRFTTDATFATTKTLNFTSGQKVGAGDERALMLRIEDIDKGAPVYKGRYAQVIGGKSEEFDCETLTKK